MCVCVCVCVCVYMMGEGTEREGEIERVREDLWHVVCQLSLGTDDTHTNGGNRTEKTGEIQKECVSVWCVTVCMVW